MEKARKGIGVYRFIGDNTTDYIFPYCSFDDRLKKSADTIKLHKKLFRSFEYFLFSIVTSLAIAIFINPLSEYPNYFFTISGVIFVLGLIYINRSFRNRPSLIIDKNGIIQDGNLLTNWDHVIRFYIRSQENTNSNTPRVGKTFNTLVIEKFGNVK